MPDDHSEVGNTTADHELLESDLDSNELDWLVAGDVCTLDSATDDCRLSLGAVVEGKMLEGDWEIPELLVAVSRDVEGWELYESILLGVCDKVCVLVIGIVDVSRSEGLRLVG